MEGSRLEKQPFPSSPMQTRKPSALLWLCWAVCCRWQNSLRQEPAFPGSKPGHPGDSQGLGRREMRSRRWLGGLGSPQSLAKSFWGPDSCPPWGLSSPLRIWWRLCSLSFQFVIKQLEVYKPSYTSVQWLQVESPVCNKYEPDYNIYAFSP